MNFYEGVRYFFCEGVGRVSITFSIVNRVIELSKGLGCVIIPRYQTWRFYHKVHTYCENVDDADH